jgi:hypothetical protein
MRSEGDTAAQLVHQAMQARREAEARQVASTLIQQHVGLDRRVIDLQDFSSALARALSAARIRGEDDAGDILTLT